ncbi:hypothetical protein [Dactylosporangium sp. CA-233914]|uniref:hypothetical protein n=1 Tax=Dactylosporangium sp. CA-233914 TaxID=3239934 RepID=UPI003D8D3D78
MSVGSALDAARIRYVRERPNFERAAAHIANAFKIAAAGIGLECRITYRAKDVASFVKKALVKKMDDPWAEIYDKAGIRVIVTHPGDLDVAKQIAATLFGPPVWEEDDRHDREKLDRLFYPRLHVWVEVPDIPDIKLESDESMQCEIQIRTEAEDLWSRMSHGLLYKPTTQLPENVVRSLYRLLALVELYDGEVERAVAAMSQDPDHRLNEILLQAEQSFYTFCSTPYDRDLSREVGRVLMRAISTAKFVTYKSDLALFVDENREQLENVYRDYGPLSSLGQQGTYILASQPESLAIFERLTNAPMLFGQIWEEELPPELLEEMKNVWGVG